MCVVVVLKGCCVGEHSVSGVFYMGGYLLIDVLSVGADRVVVRMVVCSVVVMPGLVLHSCGVCAENV